METSLRRAARVLLVDDADRPLMFRGIDPARPDDYFWMTVGGGLDDGETFAEGAARELAERTVPAFDVSTDGFDDLERSTTVEHRWWTMAELESTTETIYPPDVVERLRRRLDGAGPVTIGTPAKEEPC